MKPSMPLRVAALLMLFHAVAHTIGGVLLAPPPGSPQQAVLETMRAHAFPVMGTMRSFADFYRGYAIAIAVAMLMFVAVLWQLARPVDTEPHRVRGLLWTMLLGLSAFALAEWRYFFPLAAGTTSLAAAMIAWALWAARRPALQPAAPG